MVAQVTGGGVEIHADGGTVPIVGVFKGVNTPILQQANKSLALTIQRAPMLQTLSLL